MASISDKLRNVARPGSLCHEAADEIDRLTAEVALWESRWEAERADHERTIKHCDEIMNEGAR